MNDIDELERFIGVHSRAQGLPPELCEDVLGRVTHDGSGPGSWVGEWSLAARAAEQEGAWLVACQCWNTARFPFVDGPDRAEALERCVAAFDRWRAEHAPAIERVDVELTEPKGRVRCWAAGLSATEPRPLLVLMGGIVSIKEQWAPALLQAEQLGMAMVVTEMPGVGENTLCYDEDSWLMLPAVLDALADRADVAHTYASAMSFSGHLTLRCASRDPRIRGVVTAGAPIAEFFTDTAWQRVVPKVTVDTLIHLTRLAGASPQELFTHLRPWALTGELLAGLRIPLGYTVSLRDEIIPAGDVRVLREHVPDLSLNEYDDVHGSPSHVDETRMWAVRTILGMRAREAGVTATP
jgi:hypothetical protein